MATTISLEEQIEHRLRAESARSGESLDVVANRVLASGLPQVVGPSGPTKPFKVVPFDLALPSEWTSGCTQELIDILESSRTK